MDCMKFFRQFKVVVIFILSFWITLSAQEIQAIGDIYVLDKGGTVGIFAQDLTQLRTLDSGLNPATAIAIGPEPANIDNKYAIGLNSVNDMVVIDIETPSLSQEIDTFVNASISDPVDLAVAPNGDIYVLDKGGTVGIFAQDLTQLGTLDSGLKPAIAIAIGPDPANIDNKYAIGLNSKNKMVVKDIEKTNDGEEIDTFTDPVDLAVAPNGDIYVLDKGGTVGIFDQNLSPLSTLDSFLNPAIAIDIGPDPANIDNKYAIGIDPSSNDMVVSDIETTTNRQVIDSFNSASISDPVDLAVAPPEPPVEPPIIVNDKVNFVVKDYSFETDFTQTEILPTATPGEINFLGIGGVLHKLYGLTNLIRIDNDEIWSNLDGGATAKAKYTARDAQTLGYFDANNVFHTIFTETGEGFNVDDSTYTIPGQGVLPTFRWGLRSNGFEWSSQQSDNSGDDHMVAWFITGGPSKGNFVIAWEDFPGLGDRDYQDLVVEISNVSVSSPVGSFIITAELKNISLEKINQPVKAVVDTLEYVNKSLSQFPIKLLSATEGDGTKGSKQNIDVDGEILVPDESVTVEFLIELTVRARFSFFVNVEGVL